jgi:hypothetical protein
MTLDELLRTCANSASEDWNVLHLADDAPAMYAAYRPDLSIGLRWGIPDPAPYWETWLAFLETGEEGIPRSAVEFVYHGAPVERVTYLSVDGYRAEFPIPRLSENDDWVITRWQFDFFGMFNGLERGASEFETFIERARFVVAD